MVQTPLECDKDASEMLWGFIVFSSGVKRQQHLWHFGVKHWKGAFSNSFLSRLRRGLVPKEHRISGAYVLLVVVVANDLHVVQTELDFDAFVGGDEETESVESKLKLGTDSDEDAAFGLYAVLPAEL